jgi:hypothetical protein
MMSQTHRSSKKYCAPFKSVFSDASRACATMGTLEHDDERLRVLFEHARVLADALMAPRLGGRLRTGEWVSTETILRDWVRGRRLPTRPTPGTVGRAAHQLAAVARDARRLGETAR